MSRNVTETTSNNRNDQSCSSHDLKRATETFPLYSNKTVTTTAYEIVCAGPILQGWLYGFSVDRVLHGVTFMSIKRIE